VWTRPRPGPVVGLGVDVEFDAVASGPDHATRHPKRHNLILGYDFPVLSLK
jgi:hypothetical protein